MSFQTFRMPTYSENTMLVSSEESLSSLSGETKNSVGMAKLDETVNCVSGRA